MHGRIIATLAPLGFLVSTGLGFAPPGSASGVGATGSADAIARSLAAAPGGLFAERPDGTARVAGVATQSRSPKAQSTCRVSTLAGGAKGRLANGVGQAASFANPSGLAVDWDGNVYVAETSGHCIRKVTPRGLVSTLAGSGVAGFADGEGSAAQFNEPSGVAVDLVGNVYVADRMNARIRKVTPAGFVSTLAGSGAEGYANGPGPSAQFRRPCALALDDRGTLYVADDVNECIRIVKPTGVVTTLAGSPTAGFADGQGAVARFYYPAGVAVDARRNVYVADRNNNCIRQVTPSGEVRTLAGNGEKGLVDGRGKAAQFDDPEGLAIDAGGNLYVGDNSNNRIRRVTPAGGVTTLAGSGRIFHQPPDEQYFNDLAAYRGMESEVGWVDGPGALAMFDHPAGVAIDATGNLYVADSYNHRIRRLTGAGVVVPSLRARQAALARRRALLHGAVKARP